MPDKKLSLAFFFKDEEEALDHLLTQMLPYVDEIVGVNDNSSDSSVETVENFMGRVYTAGLSNFGAMRSLAAHLARGQVILMLDPDEGLRYPERLPALVDRLIAGETDAFALPRRRWADLDCTRELEAGAFPDWQVRLFRNSEEFRFEREIHEYFTGGQVIQLPFDQLPEIAHFDTVFHSPERLEKKVKMFRRLIARRGPSAFVAEHFQQQIKECPCFSEADTCDACVNARSVAQAIMHRFFSWEEIADVLQLRNVSIDLEQLKTEYQEVLRG